MKGFTIEFINSFAFIYFSGMTSTLHYDKGLERGLGMILLIPFLIWMSKHNNGNTFNPSIILTAFVLKYEKLNQTLIYLSAQLLGSLLGACTIYFLVDMNKTKNDNKINLIPKEGFNIFFIEFIGALFLSIITFGTFYNKKSNIIITGLSIGSFYSCFLMVFLIISGGCLNFIKIFFSSIIHQKDFTLILLYSSAHISGSILGGLFYKYILKEQNEKDN